MARDRDRSKFGIRGKSSNLVSTTVDQLPENIKQIVKQRLMDTSATFKYVGPPDVWAPNERQKKALKAIADIEAGRAATVNIQDAEECCDKGWATALNKGVYRLTDQGRELVSN